DMPMPGGGTYTMIQVGEGTGGGMMSAQPPGSPPRWQAYVGVDDVAASTRKAKELGAKIMMDKTEVGDFGLMSVIVDPTGAAIALWQSKQPQRPKNARRRNGPPRPACTRRAGAGALPVPRARPRAAGNPREREPSAYRRGPRARREHPPTTAVRRRCCARCAGRCRAGCRRWRR